MICLQRPFFCNRSPCVFNTFNVSDVDVFKKKYDEQKEAIVKVH